jgi:hypothetical protein
MKMTSTHAGRLERWLGLDAVTKISGSMRDWPGPPIAVAGVPGNVWAMRGGDFRGRIGAGQFTCALDFGIARAQRILRDTARRQRVTACAGFASLSDLIAEATAGKRREIVFQRAGPTGVIAVTSSLWRLGNQPGAGGAGSAAPGGRAVDGTVAGAIYGLDAVGPDTRHFVSAWAIASVAGQTLLLYDRLFDVACNMNSTSTQSVTGVPTRYQSSTVTDPDYAGGNFCFIEVGTPALAATAHNWTVCRYRNQAGADTISFPSMAGNSGAIVDRLDHPISSWFMPLAAGDTGVMDLDQMQSSGAMATGAGNFVIGHPIAFHPVPLANIACQYDGINTAFNLVRVFDGAALAWLELSKPSTTATTYNGGVTFVHG